MLLLKELSMVIFAISVASPGAFGAAYPSNSRFPLHLLYPRGRYLRDLLFSILSFSEFYYAKQLAMSVSLTLFFLEFRPLSARTSRKSLRLTTTSTSTTTNACAWNVWISTCPSSWICPRSTTR